MGKFIVKKATGRDKFTESKCNCKECIDMHVRSEEWESLVPQTNLQKRMKEVISKIETEGTFFRTKCIVNPNNVEVCGVHRLKRYDKSKKEVCLEPDDAFFLHYYNFSGGWGGRAKRNPLSNNNNLKLETRNIQLIKHNKIT